jgi:hypothetical protein
MADQDNADTQAGGSVPPKQMPFKPLPATPGANKEHPTIAIRRPVLRRPGEMAAPGAGAPEPEPTAAADTVNARPTVAPVPLSDAVKRKTTRIELPEALPGAGDDGEFKTVKLRPVQPPQPGSSPLPAGPKPPTPSQVQAAKSKTSRISLEAAYGAGDEVPDSSAPKTIRLKRPTELAKGATGPLAVPVATARKTSPIPPLATAQQSSTARLPTQTLNEAAVPSSEDDSSPTRRKTIKIKRPSAAAGIKINVGGGTDGGEAAEAGEGGEEMQMLALPGGRLPGEATGPGAVHWAFVVAAVAALVATLGVVWILAAQTFGPNAAVTGYTARSGADIAPPPGLVTID